MKSTRTMIAAAMMTALVGACGGTATTAPGGSGTSASGGSDSSGATGASGSTGGSTSGDTTGGSTTGGDTSTALVSGIALPQEVSALPPKSTPASSATSARALVSFFRLGDALTASSLPASSDYATTATVKWVNEQALSRFDVLNSIFTAVGQSHYADPENVNAGPYAALVTAVGGGGGDQQQQKTLETWVISSQMTKDAGGQDVNVLHVWISEEGRIIPVEMKIYAAPVQNTDGSYTNYGVWSINAGLSADGSNYFVATAEIAADGGSLVKVHQTEGGPNGPKVAAETRGILHKSGTAGYGLVSFPDFSQCMSNTCNPSTMTVAYAYDAHTVKMEMTSAGATRTVVKDRDTVIDLVERYALFDAQGNDVAKKHKFGFPIRYGSGGDSYGYYGAWQGRHQVWTNGQAALPEGAVVTRADRPPNVTAETYTASKVYTGILVKRTYTAATLDDIKDVVVNAYDFQNFFLQPVNNDGKWHRCVWPNNQPGQQGPIQPTCDAAEFTDFRSLVAVAGGNSMLNGWAPPSGGGGGGAPQPQQMMSVSVNPSGTGLVVTGTGAAYLPVTNARVDVNVGGPIWIVWDGTGWKRKQVASVDQMMQPTFGPTSTPYSIPTDGREFYLNNMGVNYVVKCTGSAPCSVQLETQLVANPANVSTFVSSSTTFTGQACGNEAPSTFHFVTDPASPKFMKLVYATVGKDCGPTSSATPQVGDVVTTGQWGFTATIGGVTTQFNWDYPSQQNGNNCPSCGVQQFLLDAQGNLVELDDPIRLAAIDLVNGAGEHHKYALSFDGSWVSGLPDLHPDLQRSNGELTAEVQAKNVNIDAGTVVTDASDSTKQYFFKPLQISQYLATVADPGGLDLTLAKALDLSTVPAWTATHIGPVPTDAVTKYSEGTKLQ